MAEILSGWYNNEPWLVITKRRKRLVDGRVYRVVELKSMKGNGTALVPIGQFKKVFKIDNNLALIYDNCT